MFTTHQLVQDFFHPQYVIMFSNYTIMMIAIICINWVIIIFYHHYPAISRLYHCHQEYRIIISSALPWISIMTIGVCNQSIKMHFIIRSNSKDNSIIQNLIIFQLHDSFRQLGWESMALHRHAPARDPVFSFSRSHWNRAVLNSTAWMSSKLAQDKLQTWHWRWIQPMKWWD